MSRLVPFAALVAGLLVSPLAAVDAQDATPGAGGEEAAQTEAPQARGPAADWSLRNLDSEQRQRMARFSTFVNGGIPHDYLKAQNTVGYTVGAIAEGGALYRTYCLECHGRMGLGNGDLAYALKPSPALLAYMVQQPVAVDQYLLWSIAEGGAQFGTAMPGFKGRLSNEQMFQIIAYLRAGFPDLDDGPPPQAGPGAATTDDPEAKAPAVE